MSLGQTRISYVFLYCSDGHLGKPANVKHESVIGGLKVIRIAWILRLLPTDWSLLAPSGALYGMMLHCIPHPLKRHSVTNKSNKYNSYGRAYLRPKTSLLLLFLLSYVSVSSVVMMHDIMVHCTWFHHSKNCDLQIWCLILRVIPILPFCSANSLLKIESVQNMVHKHIHNSHLV